MRAVALGLIVLLSACAGTRAADQSDAVEMAAAFGEAGRAYVGMGEVCDASVGGAHRAAMVQAVQVEQPKLGVLSDLANRAYRGHASPELSAHLQAQTRVMSAAAFCEGAVRQARADLAARAMQVSALEGRADGMALLRHAEQPLYPDTPHAEPIGYSAWPEGLTVIPVAD